MATSPQRAQGTQTQPKTAQAKAQHAQTDEVASCTLANLKSLWETLEKELHISYDCVDADEIEDIEIEEEWALDNEIPLCDEDALGNDADEDDGEDDTHDYPPICIQVTFEGNTAHCTAPDFGTYLSATPLPPREDSFLGALSTRQETLQKVAKWLEDNRQTFLKSREIANLGENAWEECKGGNAPVCKEKCEWNSLAVMLGINGSTFAKHIDNVFLEWPGQHVVTSIDILFCKEAKLAWGRAAYQNMPSTCSEDVRRKNLGIIATITGIKQSDITN